MSDQLLRACARGLPRLTNTRCSYARWRPLVVGTKRLSSACIGKGWIPISAPRWRYLTTPLDWKASCKKPTETPNVCLLAIPPKPPASLLHPPTVPQYQNPCRWTQPVSRVRNMLVGWQRGCAFTVLRLTISSGPAPTEPHAQRLELSSSTLTFPHCLY